MEGQGTDLFSLEIEVDDTIFELPQKAFIPFRMRTLSCCEFLPTGPGSPPLLGRLPFSGCPALPLFCILYQILYDCVHSRYILQDEAIADGLLSPTSGVLLRFMQ